MDAGFRLPDDVLQELSDRLGTPVPRSPEEFAAWYRAWSARVPFDPVAKMAAVRSGRVPPGSDPEDVANRWLTTGLGSTCWGHCAVLCAVAHSAGIPASVAVDRMLDTDIIDFHSFTVAWLEDGPFAFDPIHPSASPLPVVDGAEGDHPGYRVGFERSGGQLIHSFDHELNRRGGGRYHCLSLHLGHADVRAFCELSARYSGVSGARYFRRRLPPDGIDLVRVDDDGRTLSSLRWRHGETTEEALGDPSAELGHLDLTPEAGPLLREAGLGHGPRPWWAEEPG